MAALRGEGNATRRDRLAKLKHGPGVFVYDGGGFDTECIPTPKKHGKKTPVLSDDGMPVLDQSGRQVFERAGTLVRDMSGRPVLGGEPKVNRIPLEVLKVAGIALPTGEPVKVDDATVALKLRCMSLVKEIEPGTESEPAKRGPGRPPKAA